MKNSLISLKQHISSFHINIRPQACIQKLDKRSGDKKGIFMDFLKGFIITLKDSKVLETA